MDSIALSRIEGVRCGRPLGLPIAINAAPRRRWVTGRAPRGVDVVLGRQLIPYLVSKAGCIQWTHLLAQDLGKYNINVNCVCPGTVWTDIWESIAENRVATTDEYAGQATRDVFDSAIATRHPLAVEQTPEDIGHTVAFLASDEAAEITGQALNVNAGSVLS